MRCRGVRGLSHLTTGYRPDEAVASSVQQLVVGLKHEAAPAHLGEDHLVMFPQECAKICHRRRIADTVLRCPSLGTMHARSCRRAC